MWEVLQEEQLQFNHTCKAPAVLISPQSPKYCVGIGGSKPLNLVTQNLIYDVTYL